jgi:hypothetical protein
MTATRLALLAATILSLNAHPGHPPLSQGVSHFISSGYHLAGELLAAAIIWTSVSFCRSEPSKFDLRSLAALVAIISIAFRA